MTKAQVPEKNDDLNKKHKEEEKKKKNSKPEDATKEEEKDEESVLQKKLSVLAMQIGRWGLYAAIFVVLWLSVDFSFDKFLIKFTSISQNFVLIFPQRKIAHILLSYSLDYNIYFKLDEFYRLSG